MARRFSSGRVRACLAVVTLVLGADASGGGNDWISFVEETDSRLVADPSVGANDPFEKDIAVGDVDNDGDPDLVIVRKTPFSVPGGQPNVLFLNEGGTMVDRTDDFIPQFNDPTDDRDVILIDVDNDRWLDLITATTFGEQPRLYMNLGEDEQGQWLGFQYNPDDNRLPTFNPAPKFCAVAGGDVTGDRRPELFFVDYDNTLEDRLLINDGNGFYTDETESRMPPELSQSQFGTAAEIVEINSDGQKDIIKCSTRDDDPNSIRVLFNDGGGHFSRMQHLTPDAPYMMLTGDLNGDNRADIYVVTDGQDVFFVYIQNDEDGNAVFRDTTVTGSAGTAGFGGNIRIADMNGDGFQDVLVADIDTDIPNCNIGRLTILRNNGSPFVIALSDPLNGVQRPWKTSGTFDMAVLDIDGDDRPDLWCGTCNGNRIFINTTVTDDDECALGTDNCDVNATCTNTLGSFTCACNACYSGDGVSCALDDADGDGVCDLDDICPGFDDSIDTDGDGVPDGCDVCPGGDDTIDDNGNGIPDACEIEPPIRAPAPHDVLKNRYISIDPRGASGNNPSSHHIRVSAVSSQVIGQAGDGPWWANAPFTARDHAPCIAVVTAAKPAIEPDWTGCATLHLTGCPIIPTTTYAIAVEAGGVLSADGLFDTQAKPSIKWYGDCVGFFTGTEWTAPNNQVNIDDAVAAIKTFQDRNKTPGCDAPPCNATHVSVTDLEPNLTPDNAVPPQINSIVNIADVFHFLLGFQGLDYPGPDLTQCP